MSPTITFNMALKALFSGKKALITHGGLNRNTRYTITIQNMTTGDSYTMNRRTKGGRIKAAARMNTKGVLKATITAPNGSKITKVSIGTADVDCCIAKLVHDSINCTCKCDKCKEDLKLAEKIFLILQSAQYDATIGNVESAGEKYNKAASFCRERCACGC